MASTIAAKAGAVPAAPSDQWVISPITGERIRADQLQEHMRVALLDPRWREQRDRALEEKKRHEDPYAPGTTRFLFPFDFKYLHVAFSYLVNIASSLLG